MPKKPNDSQVKVSFDNDTNQTRKVEMPFEDQTNQTRKVGMPLEKNSFDTLGDQENPFTKMESNPANLERCVKHVKGKKGIDNPWAVCNASISKSKD